MIPLVRRLGLVEIVWLRPVVPSEHPPSLSVIVPARNERGNIEPLLRRLPEKGPDLEVILVEGNSVDGTWEEILRCVPLFEDRFPIRAVRQEGRGKADAVRLGLSLATRETVAILDADMTVPPEFLPRFLRVYAEGLGDFVNGCRLLYPMEGKAMQFLNRVANLFFAKLLAAVLDIPINDSLCGTKLFSRRDALRFRAWRTAFGDFDPFGDFELLFPASLLLSGVVDLPVRYRARTYGRTNIRRFRDGLVLLRMAMLGFLTVRLGWSRKC
jgi:glycosyltransferase involved in cell wall biosynthesis